MRTGIFRRDLSRDDCRTPFCRDTSRDDYRNLLCRDVREMIVEFYSIDTLIVTIVHAQPWRCHYGDDVKYLHV